MRQERRFYKSNHQRCQLRLVRILQHIQQPFNKDILDINFVPKFAYPNLLHYFCRGLGNTSYTTMATYIVTIDEKKTVGRNFVEFMRSMTDLVVIKKTTPNALSKDAEFIASQVEGLKKNTVKTRPLSTLLDEI